MVGTGLACRALVGRVLRVLLVRTANMRLIEALEAGSKIAVTFTGSTLHHRSFQVKATTARVGPRHSDDGPEIDRQSALFCDGLVEIGFIRDLAQGWLSIDRVDMCAVELVPERVFTQTPGPGAGAELIR